MRRRTDRFILSNPIMSRDFKNMECLKNRLSNVSSKVWLLLIGVTVLMILASWFTPWLGDDIHYGFSRTPGKQHIWISSISQIIESQNSHWYLSNGRYVAHFLVQLFIGIFGQPIFSIFNGIVYVPFLLLIAYFAKIDFNRFRTFFAMTLIALLSFQTKFVPSCQIGYIWTFTLTLTFLYFFFKSNFHPQWWVVALLGICSLIAGNGQEALNIGIGGALIIYWAFNMRRMTIAQYVMMICFGLGALLDCLSPGSMTRAAHESGGNSLMGSLINFLFESRAFYMLVIILIWKLRCLKVGIRDIYETNKFYWHAWAILLLFNFLIGIKSNRQLFGEELMSIIISFRLLGINKIKNGWIILLCGLLAFTYIVMGICDIQSYRQWESIKKQYAISNDGVVYVDMNRPIEDWWIAPMKFSDKMNYSKIGDPNYEWVEYNANRYLHHFYPGKPDYTVVTPLLKDIDAMNPENKIVPIKFGVYLIIQNKKSIKKPVLKSFSRYGNAKDTVVEPIDMNCELVLETPTYKAKQYQIGSLSRIARTKQIVDFE